MQPHSKGVGVSASPCEFGSSRSGSQSLGTVRFQGPGEDQGQLLRTTGSPGGRGEGGLQADPLPRKVHGAVWASLAIASWGCGASSGRLRPLPGAAGRGLLLQGLLPAGVATGNPGHGHAEPPGAPCPSEHRVCSGSAHTLHKGGPGATDPLTPGPRPTCGHHCDLLSAHPSLKGPACPFPPHMLSTSGIYCSCSLQSRGPRPVSWGRPGPGAGLLSGGARGAPGGLAGGLAFPRNPNTTISWGHGEPALRPWCRPEPQVPGAAWRARSQGRNRAHTHTRTRPCTNTHSCTPQGRLLFYC